MTTTTEQKLAAIVYQAGTLSITLQQLQALQLCELRQEVDDIQDQHSCSVHPLKAHLQTLECGVTCRGHSNT